MRNKMLQILEQHPVVPVITFSHIDQAVPLAETLMSAGISIMEVTLRSAIAIPAIEKIASRLPGMMIGAGTVTQPEEFFSITGAGARFAVSPATTNTLLEEAAHWNIPYLPAAATPSEVMLLADHGYKIQKLFPVSAFGGISLIRAMKGPLPHIRFCPSGGVNEKNYLEYLAEDNVLSVSGTWMVPGDALATKDWSRIALLAKDCLRRLAEKPN